jgi:hypothetical protein
MTTPATVVHSAALTAPDRARVAFRQPVSTDGYFDAGWWPRSRDLTRELPGLLDVLWTAAREVTRIGYHLEFWDPAPRKIIIDGRLVRLAGYHYQDPLLLSATNAGNTDRIEFLIIPPLTEPKFAERALQLASAIGQLHTPADLLALAQQ